MIHTGLEADNPQVQRYYNFHHDELFIPNYYFTSMELALPFVQRIQQQGLRSFR